MFRHSHIQRLTAREILDSRGNPTIRATIALKSGVMTSASVPSGASTGSHEAVELRDGGSRYGGQGVRKAIQHIQQRIAPLMLGIDVHRQCDIDQVMIELDGTKNKKRLGANAILAVSLACARASAIERRLPLWQSLRRTFSFARLAAMPTPTMNVLNGGVHAGWVMDIQECMIVPRRKSFSERLRIGAEVFHSLKKLLTQHGQPTTVGDEGGFAPKLASAEVAFDILLEAIKRAGYVAGRDVSLAADIASSEFYDKKNQRYVFRAEGKSFTAKQLLKRYQSWLVMYPFVSIEDPFAEDDWLSWQTGLPSFSAQQVSLVGDDLLVTQVARLQKAIKHEAASAILIKLNQVGTLTETVAAITMAHNNGWATSISHRSGETVDAFIADLAVACGSEYIKTGSLSRSERVEKYNRLLEIEEEIGQPTT